MSEGNGTGFKRLFEVRTPKPIGGVTIDGIDYEIKMPRVKHLSRFMQAQKELRGIAKLDDSVTPEQQGAIVEFLCIVLDAPRDVIDNLEIDAIHGLYGPIGDAINTLSAAKEGALGSDPRLPTSSPSDTSGQDGSPPMSS